MRKYITIIIFCVVLLSLTACKKTSIETTANPQPTTLEEVNPETATPDTSSINTSSPDANSPDSTPGTSEEISITNEGLLSELQAFIENFYYNFLFSPQLDTGVLSETDMQLFAISYIYQYEYEDLRFDSEKFLLYIPEENVSEVVKRFFDYEITQHKYPENSSITYENGYYLMKATSEELGAKPIIKEAVVYDESKYKVVFESSDTNANEYIVATIQEKEDRFILLTYKKLEKTN